MQKNTIGNSEVTKDVVNQVTEVSRETSPTLAEFINWVKEKYVPLYVKAGFSQKLLEADREMMHDAMETFKRGRKVEVVK